MKTFKYNNENCNLEIYDVDNRAVIAIETPTKKDFSGLTTLHATAEHCMYFRPTYLHFADKEATKERQELVDSFVKKGMLQKTIFNNEVCYKITEKILKYVNPNTDFEIISFPDGNVAKETIQKENNCYNCYSRLLPIEDELEQEIKDKAQDKEETTEQENSEYDFDDDFSDSCEG